jgi:O-antigen/teichoic acid export membrane protein
VRERLLALLGRLRQQIGGERRLALGSLILLAANIGGATIGFLISISIGRSWGSARFGDYAFISAILSTLDIAAEVGLDSLLTRDVAAQPGRSRPYVGILLRVKVVIAALIVGGLLLAAPALGRNDEVRDALRMAALAVLPLQFNSVFIALFRGWQRMEIVLCLSLGSLALILGGYWLVIVLGGNLAQLWLVYAIGQAGQTLVAWLIYRRIAPQPEGDVLTMRPLLTRALPFAIAGGLSTLGTRVDLFYIYPVNGAPAAGLYTVGLKFFDAMRLPANAFFGALFPNLAERAASSPRHALITFRRALLILAAYAIVAAAFTAAISSPLIGQTFGAEYEVSAHILRLLLWVNLPFLLNAACSYYLYARRDERYVNVIQATNLLLRLALVGPLVVWQGPLGAVGALMLAETLTLAFYTLRVRYIVAQNAPA